MKYFCRSLEWLSRLLESYCLDVCLFWLGVLSVVILITVVIWRRYHHPTRFNSLPEQSKLQGIALLLIPIVGGLWAIYQFRTVNDVQLRIEMNQPEIHKDSKTDSYVVNVSVEIANSGRNVEFVFIDKYKKFLNGDDDENKELNECIDEINGIYTSKNKNEATVSCFMARRVEDKDKEIIPVSSTMTGPQAVNKTAGPQALIRKGAAYDYSALYKLKEPGWYSLEFYLVVDYNKGTLPILYRKHPKRYVTWISKTYVFIGEEDTIN